MKYHIEALLSNGTWETGNFYTSDLDTAVDFVESVSFESFKATGIKKLHVVDDTGKVLVEKLPAMWRRFLPQEQAEGEAV